MEGESKSRHHIFREPVEIAVNPSFPKLPVCLNKGLRDGLFMQAWMKPTDWQLVAIETMEFQNFPACTQTP